ncbi:MAG: hypothetical protein A2Z18_11175 [Armatimonadetes bacterium RBG_16_58_9]|nr:MAG: hypothetical protein A2Z18_11175 [Armatimonadetes bacterium RBG_16_58_9]
MKETYRGEEIGKAAITDEQGDLKMLLGGQSIRPYEITWEGRKTARSKVKKRVERYLSTKILLRKSSARIIAALDQASGRHPGYVFPQSVYAIELQLRGMHELYLLCLLNSEVMNEYLWRTVTGYKFLQPQIELEDIRALPIRRVNFTTPENERSALASQGIRIFDRECLRAANSAPFPELGEFVATCIGGGTDKSDVVHDILVTLGRRMTVLTKRARRSPSADTTNRMTVTRAAIETIVWRLYSSRPAQMALPL